MLKTIYFITWFLECDVAANHEMVFLWVRVCSSAREHEKIASFWGTPRAPIWHICKAAQMAEKFGFWSTSTRCPRFLETTGSVGQFIIWILTLKKAISWNNEDIDAWPTKKFFISYLINVIIITVIKKSCQQAFRFSTLSTKLSTNW